MYGRIVCVLVFAAAAWAQGPVITGYTTGIPGVTVVGPGTAIYILGTFVLHSAGRDYTIAVGGQTSGINVEDATTYITATIPVAAPAGPTTLVVTYQGQASNAIPITIGVPQPQLAGVGVSILSSTAPPQFLPYYPIVHNNSQANVTPTAPAALDEVLQVLVGGLGPDVAPTAAPSITVGGQNATILQIGVDASNGRETLYFQVPGNAPLGIDQVVASVSGVLSNSVGIPVGPGPEVGSVLNGASFGSPDVVAPGSIISVFGAGFGAQDNLSAFPQTSVNGVSVLFGSTPAPIFALAAKEGQINVLVPTELASSGIVMSTSTAQLRVATADHPSDRGQLKELETTHIRLDGGTQVRAGIRADIVRRYADSMRQGEAFPPVRVWFDGVNHWLADGFHRVSAAELAGIRFIKAEVNVDGTPTILMVDRTGVIRRSWLGLLQTDTSQDVLDLVDSPQKVADKTSDGPRDDLITQAELDARVRNSEPFSIIDIRERSAYSREHRKGAVNIPLPELFIRSPFELSDSGLQVIDCAGFKPKECKRAADQLIHNDFSVRLIASAHSSSSEYTPR